MKNTPLFVKSTLRILTAWGLSLLLAVSCLTAGEQEAPKPFPNMAQHVGQLLQHLYYDAQRIDPVRMFERALRALEGAEISIQAQWNEEELILRANRREQRMSAPRPQSLRDTMRLLDRLREALLASGFDANRKRELSYHMLNGALASLDPHTVVMPPQRASAFSEDIAGEFFGVGAYLNQERGVIRIERVMPGLPAEQAGVQDGDIILAVDNEPTVGLSLSQAVSRIRGPKGTTVLLTMEREGLDEPIDIPTVRDLIEPPTLVTWHQGPIAYVRLDDFNRNSNRQLDAALRGLEQEMQQPLEGLVLDLRFNGGGLLQQAYIIADMFLSHSREVVRTVTKDQHPHIMRSGPREVLSETPMIVLVGPGSASASEILAGALQLNNRAVVAGMTSYGKGSVQSLRSLPDDANLKLTIQEYQLRDGVSIQGRGVQPDLLYHRHSMNERGAVDLVPYSVLSEADHEFALSPLAEEPLKQAALRLEWLAEYEDEDRRRQSRISARDFQPDQEARLTIDLFQQALSAEDAAERIAHSWLSNSMRQVSIDLLEKAVEQRSMQESQRLSEALAALDPPIRWGTAGEVPDQALKMRFLGPSQVIPGEDAELRFAIDNQHQQEIGQLYGLVQADAASPLWEQEYIIGVIPAQGTQEAVLHFAVPPRLHPGHEAFVVELRQAGRIEPLLELPVALAIGEAPRPHFNASWELRDAESEEVLVGQGLPLDQRLYLDLRIRNDGRGDSQPIMLYVFKDDDPFVALEQGRFSLPAIAAGAERLVRVPFQVSSSPPAGYRARSLSSVIALQVHAEEDGPEGRDNRYRERFFHSLRLPVGEQNNEDLPLMGDINKPVLELLDIHYQGERAHLRLRVQDENLRYLALFHGRVKHSLKEFPDRSGESIHTFEIPLEQGLNELRIVASDADEVSSVLPLRLWGEDIILADRPTVPSE